MKASEVRSKFLEFFKRKGHEIVQSAPIVSKDDPSLMFANAGMNQFKDYFLGNKFPENRRIADTQKCLRVSGKHNDLEEVGKDSYHHTMFEMLGNWSFGDYFKKEAIGWAWEFLTLEMKIDPERIYATCFGGDKSESLREDSEAFSYWKNCLPEERIMFFGKKDNFWEMGETGPCGPCSEIHIDIRPKEERKKVPGRTLVNMDHPEVIEIWNLVFIQYNRKADGTLEELPEKHVDTGMGFERLCMLLQSKNSSYDTDVFTPFINLVEKKSGKTYTKSYAEDAWSDIAMRVIVDHIRAVSFTVADGELPGNTGAGYVIRRILRRAVRYYYSFLGIKEPFIYSLVKPLAETFTNVFPELLAQKDFVEKVIKEEEYNFLRTLSEGLKKLDNVKIEDNLIDGDIAFELYDTYGFPIDLTRLIASEKGYKVDEKGFTIALERQKERSRADAKQTIGDWISVPGKDQVETSFIGYDFLETEDSHLLRYRTVFSKNTEQYQLVLDKSPFYPESGGQVGDAGRLYIGDETIKVVDTQKEGELIVHIVNKLPSQPELPIKAEVDRYKRRLTENNHSATHLLQAALRKVLGNHVHQRGSLVASDHLRFDFSHFQKMTEKEIAQVEQIVNQKIRQNIPRKEDRQIPIQKAKEAGAMMLFGEKYGDMVRMISFDPEYSVELCGGCHVDATGQVGYFKIVSETGIAAGVRRIEAITADRAEKYINNELSELSAIRNLFKNSKKTLQKISDLQEENRKLRKEIEILNVERASVLKTKLKSHFKEISGINFLSEKIPSQDSKTAKTLAYNLEQEIGDAFIVFGMEINGKAQLMVTISQNLAGQGNLHAGQIVKELAKEINGGGGGQAFFATAGGKNPAGISLALQKAKEFI